MKLLLHICCAPCSIYPFQQLTVRDNLELAAFFYNPNIHPYSEYLSRRKSVEEFSRKNSLTLNCHKYDIENFFRLVASNEDSRKRCPLCWRMRLEETALFARENNFDLFSTTLLISPYQNHDLVRKIGEGIAKEQGVKFYYCDFRDGFRHSQDEARRHNLYRQKYCGCIYSERERYEKPEKVIEAEPQSGEPQSGEPQSGFKRCLP